MILIPPRRVWTDHGVMGALYPDCGPHCETGPGGPDRHHHCPECHPEQAEVAAGDYFTASPSRSDEVSQVLPAIGVALIAVCAVLLTLAATGVIDLDETTFIRLNLVTAALAVAVIARVMRSNRR
ncbi:hypothetical protein [Frankia sp. CcI49]|uniref:hypothetical protein n=1 Tax=Frankia sp. CcI49 TaxID=1745382 RepID=UPI001055BADD|nr:hypothetical protein [Frankia sp. CcI49]